MTRLPSASEYIDELNVELKKHPDYLEGMEFKSLYPSRNLLTFQDPRLQAFLEDDKREHEHYSLAPFEDTIKAYKDKHK